jgi:hypothetical protein
MGLYQFVVCVDSAQRGSSYRESSPKRARKLDK